MKKYDLITMGEAVVEFFRKNPDEGLNEPFDFVGPFPSGAPAITADTMAKLGGKCLFFATVGNDEFGFCVADRLKKDGVDVSEIHFLENIITGIAFTRYLCDGSRKFLYNFTSAAPALFSPEHLQEEKIRESKWLHISGNVMAFSETAREAVLRACEVAKEAGTKISFDPNIRLELMDRHSLFAMFRPVLECASLVIPSEKELSMIFEIQNEQAGIKRLLQSGVETVVLKQGKRGCSIYGANEEAVQIPAMKNVAEVDATGCGDAFCAGFIYGMVRGWDAKVCGLFANAVGGITATKKGAMEGVQSIDDVYALLKQNGVKIF